MVDDRYRKRSTFYRDRYAGRTYDSLDRFVSYWHQIDVIRSAEPDRVLEIGVGNGFVSNYLRDRGLDVVTLDVNPALGPDVLGSITEIPFPDDSFDVVSACEVLEHLPQDLTVDALREMGRAGRDRVLISLPNKTIAYAMQLSLPKLGLHQMLIERSAPSEPRGEAHYWEIGHCGISAASVRQWIGEAGLEIERDYRPFHNPKHHFFVLRVQ